MMEQAGLRYSALAKGVTTETFRGRKTLWFQTKSVRGALTAGVWPAVPTEALSFSQALRCQPHAPRRAWCWIRSGRGHGAFLSAPALPTWTALSLSAAETTLTTRQSQLGAQWAMKGPCVQIAPKATLVEATAGCENVSRAKVQDQQ